MAGLNFEVFNTAIYGKIVWCSFKNIFSSVYYRIQEKVHNDIAHKKLGYTFQNLLAIR